MDAFQARGPLDPISGLTSFVSIGTILTSLSFYFSSMQRAEIVADNFNNLINPFSEDDQFDFIVVGGGTGGGVVAARLSTRYSVLLLEAGGDMNDIQLIPALTMLLLNYDQIDWMLKTVPQKASCFACKDGKSHWSAGKGLGGTSNLHFLYNTKKVVLKGQLAILSLPDTTRIQSRGNKKDYDNWANITKDKNWNYKNVLPYFKKSEDYYGRWAESAAHGRGGPIVIQEPDYKGMADMYIEAAKELGYDRADLNGFYKQGFDTVFYSVKNGRRNDVYSSYINPSRNSTNLTIRKFAFVKKILIDKNKRAYGVLYDHHGSEKTAIVHREIILSAGVINSPKLLMLSGVGPRKHLQKMKIPVIQALPVGRNLQDHLSTYLGPFFVNQPVSFSVERDVINPATLADFLTQGTGPLTTTGVQAMGIISSNYTNDKDWPDILMMLMGVSIGINFPHDLARGFGIKEEVLQEYFNHAIGRDSFFQVVSPARPLSKGFMQLKSTDPYKYPMLEPRYYHNEIDMEVMIEGVQKAVELVEKTKAFQKIGGSFTDQPFPGCEGYVFRSSDYWECYTRQFSVSLHNMVGTCSMGKVVDSQLRVIGIKGLRVADASVMPSIVVGDTNVPTIMIGEKAADMIMQYWKSHGVYRQ